MGAMYSIRSLKKNDLSNTNMNISRLYLKYNPLYYCQGTLELETSRAGSEFRLCLYGLNPAHIQGVKDVTAGRDVDIVWKWGRM